MWNRANCNSAACIGSADTTASAIISTNPAECLKPWPDQADTSSIRSFSGARPIRKSPSLVIV